MKILIVIPAFPLELGNIKGGVNSALSNLLKGFANADITIRVVSFNRGLNEPRIVNYSENIAIHYMPEDKFPHVFNFAFKGSAAIKRHIREFNPAVVHFAMSGYILLTRISGLLNKVQLVTIHGVPFAEARQKINKKEKLVYYTNGIVERMFCPDNIIHISNYSSAQYSSNKTSSTIIPNAIDPGYFKIPMKTTTTNKLLYVGTIEARKNILYILKALKVLVDKGMFFTLEVLGGFTDEAYKEAVLGFIKANSLEEYVTLYGWLPQQKVQEVLSQVDILVVASKQETLPMVIAESMSAGKVVVCATVGGIPEMVIHGEDGFLYDISSIDNVLPILEQLYNNNVLVQGIQAMARKKAISNYHCDSVAQRTIAFYKKLCEVN